jgi:hypothetical protein
LSAAVEATFADTVVLMPHRVKCRTFVFALGLSGLLVTALKGIPGATV